MLNKFVLIPGVFIERISDHTVYLVQFTSEQVVVLRNISTDTLISLPISSINTSEYEIVEVKGDYTM